ncbi:MAG: matrixin family metalloprotease [Pseudomonadota bacterium]
MASRGLRHLELIPLGRIDQVAVSVVAANVQTLTGLLVDVAPAWSEPEHALLHPRMQYNALPILKDLAEDAGLQGRLRLGIINGDLCLPILSYVFGEAQLGGRAAVISLHRLHRGADGRAISSSAMYERLAKVAVHETAHILGLKHCRAPRCIMAFSLGLKQLDDLYLGFCPDCEEELRFHLRK